MAETFGLFLREAIRRQGMTLRAYALSIGLGKSHSFAYRVAQDKVGPPLKDLKRWAEPLKLNASEYRRFELLAGIAHASPAVKEWFEEVEGWQTKGKAKGSQ